MDIEEDANALLSNEYILASIGYAEPPAIRAPAVIPMEPMADESSTGTDTSLQEDNNDSDSASESLSECWESMLEPKEQAQNNLRKWNGQRSHNKDQK
jgi:hypothetical protein